MWFDKFVSIMQSYFQPPSHIISYSAQMGQKALMFSAPAIWKSLWKKLKSKKFTTLGELKTVVKSVVNDSPGNCLCYYQLY